MGIRFVPLFCMVSLIAAHAAPETLAAVAVVDSQAAYPEGPLWRDGKPFVGPNDFAADGLGGIYFSASGVYDLKAPISEAVLYLSAGQSAPSASSSAATSGPNFGGFASHDGLMPCSISARLQTGPIDATTRPFIRLASWSARPVLAATA
jgi:hypothetical protein